MDNEAFLVNMRKNTCIYMKCYVQSDYAQINFTLSTRTLYRIAQLGIDLEVSILSWGGVKDRKNKKKGKKKSN